MVNIEIYDKMMANMNREIRVKLKDGDVVVGTLVNAEKAGENCDIPGCEDQVVYYIRGKDGGMVAECEIDSIETPE